MKDLCFAYYCSGHGYGHATRVSALTCHLLRLTTPYNIRIHIISSAPQHVFAESLALGALYRYAEIDPVIVQPLAYRVDRQKSVDVLKSFLSRKETILEIEGRWLLDVNAVCVLSDAAFLGCLAAKAVGLPSILITNFTFDSVYSYLSAPATQISTEHSGLDVQPSGNFEALVPDIPIPLDDLNPLVDQIHAGYRCADLLLLLPGNIPIPSFSRSPSLPAQDWVDHRINRFHPEITASLAVPSSPDLHDVIPFPHAYQPFPTRTLSSPRSIQLAPLLVRPLTVASSICTPSGRARLLSSIGVPAELYNPTTTKVLVISFGGQLVRRPKSSQTSRPPSRPPSRPESRNSGEKPDIVRNETSSQQTSSAVCPTHDFPGNNGYARSPHVQEPSFRTNADDLFLQNGSLDYTAITTSNSERHMRTSQRIATLSHIWIPGAPPVAIPPDSPSPQQSCKPVFSMNLEIPTPPDDGQQSYFESAVESDGPRLLPDSSWIAIVCGVSKEQWNELNSDSDSELPDGFFVAPRDVYMPDLTAVADVLLGKLGYGTVSECVDSCTPFVYVSRPLFIEEHGLRLLLDREGVGVELSRQSYEAGDWASAVEEAWIKGRNAKAKTRMKAEMGIGLDKRNEEGQKLARHVVDWTQEWWATVQIR